MAGDRDSATASRLAGCPAASGSSPENDLLDFCTEFSRRGTAWFFAVAVVLQGAARVRRVSYVSAGC